LMATDEPVIYSDSPTDVLSILRFRGRLGFVVVAKEDWEDEEPSLVKIGRLTMSLQLIDDRFSAGYMFTDPRTQGRSGPLDRSPEKQQHDQ
jgi:hypothetical protein